MISLNNIWFKTENSLIFLFLNCCRIDINEWKASQTISLFNLIAICVNHFKYILFELLTIHAVPFQYGVFPIALPAEKPGPVTPVAPVGPVGRARQSRNRVGMTGSPGDSWRAGAGNSAQTAG